MKQILFGLLLVLAACGQSSGDSKTGKASFGLWTDNESGLTLDLSDKNIGYVYAYTNENTGCSYEVRSEGTESYFEIKKVTVSPAAMGCFDLSPMDYLHTNDGTTLTVCHRDQALFGRCHTYH